MASAGTMNPSKALQLSVHNANNRMLAPVAANPAPAAGDYLPNELLVALFDQPPAPERLAPPTRLPSLNVSTVVTRKAPANVWNYPKQRERLKHLVANTPCICGAGRDISFLYDVSKKKEVPTVQNDTLDTSQPRAKEIKSNVKKSLELSDSLVPDEYRIVKNKGVLGLESHDEKPSSRFEVLQLKQTLNDMLEKAGVHDEINELTAPTQMHRLLELIKREQNIYNIIFHELIRQVSVECIERGELLATVRQHYADLLSQVPKQIKSLHDEVLAQRALDRRLTEELVSFQNTVSLLASELNAVKEHDRQVMEQAKQVQLDLKTALDDASRNSSMLAEYRELYELQRQRLEKQVELLSEELMTWCDASYCLAGKVIEEHSLNSTRLLCVTEKSWSRLGDHFAVALCDRDMAELTTFQTNVDSWHLALDAFDEQVSLHEDDVRHQLRMILDDLQQWIDISVESSSVVGKDYAIPADKVNSLANELKSWDQTLSYVSDKFGGEAVLASQEQLTNIRRFMSAWTNCALRIFLRHVTEAGEQHPLHSHMMHVNQQVETLLKLYSARITGENGVVDNVLSVGNGIEAWNTRLIASTSLSDQQRVQLFEQIEGWVMSLSESIANIGSSPVDRKTNASGENKVIKIRLTGLFVETETGVMIASVRKVQKSEVVNIVRKWLKATHHSIDSEDAKLTEQVSILHRQMIQWTTKAIVSLVPSGHVLSKEAQEAELAKSVPVDQLMVDAKSLSGTLTDFTKLLTGRCSQFIAMERQSRLDRGDDDADHEHLELIRFNSECEEWAKLATIVLTELSLVSDRRRALQEKSLAVAITSENAETLSSDVDQMENVAGFQDPSKTDALQCNTVDTLASALNTDRLSPHSGLHTPLVSHQTSDLSSRTPVAQNKSFVDVTAIADAENLESETAEDAVATNAVDTEKTPEVIKSHPSVDHVEVIGYDASTRTVTLPPSQLVGQTSDGDTSKGYMAFASVQYLQHQLLVTEARAQEAEERAVSAEAALVDALERLRAVERGRSSATPSVAASMSAAPSVTSLSISSSHREKHTVASTSTSSARDKSFHKSSSKIKTKKK